MLEKPCMVGALTAIHHVPGNHALKEPFSSYIKLVVYCCLTINVKLLAIHRCITNIAEAGSTVSH